MKWLGKTNAKSLTVNEILSFPADAVVWAEPIS
jgi:hypothetical protein